MLDNHVRYQVSDVCDLQGWGAHQSVLGMIGEIPGDTFTSTKFHWGESNYSDNIISSISQSMIGSGPGKLRFAYIIGFDAMNDKKVVMVEGLGEYSIELYNLQDDNLVYANKAAGGFGDADDKLNNPIDVTVDQNNNVYVLDSLSNSHPRVKKFDSNLNSLGSFGTIDEITGQPIAIDACDIDNTIHVLHIEGIQVYQQ